MAEFLTTRGTSFHIENIILEVKNQLTLVSPFLQLSKTLFERLKDASNRGVEILIIYGKDDLKPNEKNSLAELKTIRLYFHENLHAKCYFNETKMVITSMNMYQFSENNNREMGVLIDAIIDKDLYQKAVNEAQSIVKHSEVIKLQKSERTFYHQEVSNSNSKSNGKYQPQPPHMGYCLRCEERIPYDPFRPYCYECYSIWAVYENVNYKENVCHCCGEFSPASMSRPVCNPCFDKFPFSNQFVSF
jgi:hypothetical protein